MFEITVKTDKNVVVGKFQKEILLSEALEQMGFVQNMPCGGKGICGKCKVRLDDKDVLSCITTVRDNATVYYNIKSRDVQGVTDGYTVEYQKNPLVKEGYGMAIDIGTTTVAGYICKFPEGICVKKTALPNIQAQHGADVISRIEYSNNGGLLELQSMIKKVISELSEGKKIEKYVICGNTVMLHLLTGMDPRGIAVSPFTPQSLFGEWIENVYLPPCISSYVGADITTAILSSGMTKDNTSFLVDIGTNGEMALIHEGKLVCCSTAAGPAFEGNGIKYGMLATEGAISKVWAENGQVKYKTIGDVKPIGLCGTGLIDAVATMLDLEYLDETGYMDDDFEIGDSGIFVTIDDIRQVQLAKSAIRSGIDTLLHECSIDCDSIEKFYIAGGFGNFIDKVSASKIGLIPKEVLDKVVVTGNGAGNGALMILNSEECLSEAERIASLATTTELSQSGYFMDKYIDNMMF